MFILKFTISSLMAAAFTQIEQTIFGVNYYG